MALHYLETQEVVLCLKADNATPESVRAAELSSLNNQSFPRCMAGDVLVCLYEITGTSE